MGDIVIDAGYVYTVENLISKDGAPLPFLYDSCREMHDLNGTIVLSMLPEGRDANE